MVYHVNGRISLQRVREEEDSNIKVISTVRSSFETCRCLRRQNVGGVVALDIKGTELGTEQGEIMMISLSDRSGQIYIFDVYRNPSLVSEGGLEQFLTSRQVTKVVHGADVVCSTFFWRIGCYIENVFDTQICHRILVDSPSALGSTSDHDSESESDKSPTPQHSPILQRLSVSVPVNSWQSDQAIRHHVSKPQRKNPIGLIIRNKMKRSETPDVNSNRISLVDVSYGCNYYNSTTEDSVMKLCRTYDVACEPLNALTEYRLRQLQQYWRVRPITHQMTSAINRDISPLIGLYDKMTQLMEGSAVSFVIDISSRISRNRVAPPKSQSRRPTITLQKAGSQVPSPVGKAGSLVVTPNKSATMVPGASKPTTSHIAELTASSSRLPAPRRPTATAEIKTTVPNGKPPTGCTLPTIVTNAGPGTSVNFKPASADIMTRG